MATARIQGGREEGVSSAGVRVFVSCIAALPLECRAKTNPRIWGASTLNRLRDPGCDVRHSHSRKDVIGGHCRCRDTGSYPVTMAPVHMDESWR